MRDRSRVESAGEKKELSCLWPGAQLDIGSATLLDLFDNLQKLELDIMIRSQI
jgi:hypothetical protein